MYLLGCIVLYSEKFSDMQFDVMLSNMAGGYFEKDIRTLNEWKHGETYIRLPMHNDWADYNPKVKVFNGMKMLLSKSIAPQLCTGLTPTIMILLYLQEQIIMCLVYPQKILVF